jgi:hypothetical protein
MVSHKSITSAVDFDLLLNGTQSLDADLKMVDRVRNDSKRFPDLSLREVNKFVVS